MDGSDMKMNAQEQGSYSVGSDSVSNMAQSSKSSRVARKHTVDSIELIENALQDLITDSDRRRGWCQGEPISESGKRRQITKMMSLLLIPVIALLAISSYFVTETVMINRQNEQTRRIIKFSIELGEVLHMLQLERDQSVLYLSNIGPATKTYLLKQYLETNEYIDMLSMWPGELENNAIEYVRSRKVFQRHITSHRNSLELLNITAFDEIEFYNELITVFHKWLYRTLDESRYSTMWKTLVAYQKVIFARLDIGVERALGAFFFSIGGFDHHKTYEWYNRELNVFRHSFRTAQNFSDLVKPLTHYEVALVPGQNLTNIIQTYRRQIQYLNISQPSLRDGQYWFDNVTAHIDILLEIQTILAKDILALVNEKQSSTVGTLVISVALVTIVTAMIPMLTQAIHRVTSDLQNFAIILADKTKELDRERGKTDALLHQMLPKQVAKQLKQGKAVKAEYYKQVTVFFSDTGGFTGLSAACTPMELVELLNQLYRLFDSRIDLYNVYKVETVGDSYMVASGVPTPNGRRHAIEIANMSLDLLASAIVQHPAVPDGKVGLRIGIHTGPVVAGIVGSRLPRYCLFGDTVNTASRMETTGKPDRIHISTETFKLLDKVGGYKMTCRGPMEVKGKGTIVTYWLEGHLSANGLPYARLEDTPTFEREPSGNSPSGQVWAPHRKLGPNDTTIRQMDAENLAEKKLHKKTQQGHTKREATDNSKVRKSTQMTSAASQAERKKEAPRSDIMQDNAADEILQQTNANLMIPSELSGKGSSSKSSNETSNDVDPTVKGTPAIPEPVPSHKADPTSGQSSGDTGNEEYMMTLRKVAISPGPEADLEGGPLPSYPQLEKAVKENPGDPPIFQLTEGHHF